MMALDQPMMFGKVKGSKLGRSRFVSLVTGIHSSTMSSQNN